MKRKVALIILVGVTLFTLIIGIFYVKGYQPTENIHKDLNFDFPVKDIRGNLISNELFKGRSVIMIFFNTQCDLCLAEIDLLTDKLGLISSQYYIVFVSFEPEDSLSSFFKNYEMHNKLGIYIVSDERANLLNYYDIEGYPSFLIFDKHGNLIRKGSALDEHIISEILDVNKNNSANEY